MDGKKFFRVLLLTMYGAISSLVSAEETRVRWPAPDTPGWTALPAARFDAPGSIMDFSPLLDAPAGKYGRLTVNPRGHFSFAARPAEDVRFYGVNLCYSAAFPSREQAEQLADAIARAGYNSVRLHHNDGMLLADSPGGMKLDPAMLDRQDYLIHCLKRRGIYLTVDLYCDRKLSPEETAGLPPECQAGFKGLLPLRAEGMTTAATRSPAGCDQVERLRQITCPTGISFPSTWMVMLGESDADP